MVEAEPSASRRKCFLGGLSWETTEETLREHFSKYGEIDEAIVKTDRTTHQPRGFGFVTFKEEGAAQAACAEPHVIDGRTIDAKPSVPQGEGSRPRSRKIFVGGLSGDTTEEGFRAYFEKFGAVAEATVMVDHATSRSRGFGFVTFDDEATASLVFGAGQMHELDGKQVEVKGATPKGSGPLGHHHHQPPGFDPSTPVRPGLPLGQGPPAFGAGGGPLPARGGYGGSSTTITTRSGFPGGVSGPGPPPYGMLGTPGGGGYGRGGGAAGAGGGGGGYQGEQYGAAPPGGGYGAAYGQQGGVPPGYGPVPYSAYGAYAPYPGMVMVPGGYNLGGPGPGGGYSPGGAAPGGGYSPGGPAQGGGYGTPTSGYSTAFPYAYPMPSHQPPLGLGYAPAMGGVPPGHLLQLSPAGQPQTPQQHVQVPPHQMHQQQQHHHHLQQQQQQQHHHHQQQMQQHQQQQQQMQQHMQQQPGEGRFHPYQG